MSLCALFGPLLANSLSSCISWWNPALITAVLGCPEEGCCLLHVQPLIWLVLGIIAMVRLKLGALFYSLAPLQACCQSRFPCCSTQHAAPPSSC
jgi:hypothetical protein